VKQIVIKGDLDGEGMHIGIAAATWNQSITDRLVDGAKERSEAMGVSKVTILRVPGALEVPLAAEALATNGCDAVVAIGAVVKGETDHYEIVVRESSAGLSRVSLDTGVPIANGILAVHDFSQAMERAGEGDANRGAEAAEAAVSMARALAELNGA